MATEVASELQVDAMRLLGEIRKHPRRWSELRALLEHDRDRLIRAMDRLDGLGVIRQRRINGDTHFECVPTTTVL